MPTRRSNRASGYGRLAALATALLLAACSTMRPLTDPGRLEVWNGLRDQLAVVVGGRLYQIPACAVSIFEDVELRGVKVTTSAAMVVAEFAADLRATPIGANRYIVIGPDVVGRGGEPLGGNPVVMDVRTRPPFERPAGRNCTLTLNDLIEQGAPGQE